MNLAKPPIIFGSYCACWYIRKLKSELRRYYRICMLKLSEKRKSDSLQDFSKTFVDVTIVDTTTAMNLNKDFRKKDYIPDVISFQDQDWAEFLHHLKLIDSINNQLLSVTKTPKDSIQSHDFQYQGARTIGQIAICCAKIDDDCKIFEISRSQMIIKLFVHSVLHCFGYCHEEEEEAIVMESIESDILSIPIRFRLDRKKLLCQLQEI